MLPNTSLSIFFFNPNAKSINIIQTWDNQGGNLTNAIQNTANRRPQYKDVTGANLNGLPIV